MANELQQQDAGVQNMCRRGLGTRIWRRQWKVVPASDRSVLDRVPQRNLGLSGA